MGQRVSSYACQDCGRIVVRRTRSDRARVCLDCGIERVAANAYRRAAYGQLRRAVLNRQRTRVEV